MVAVHHLEGRDSQLRLEQRGQRLRPLGSRLSLGNQLPPREESPLGNRHRLHRLLPILVRISEEEAIRSSHPSTQRRRRLVSHRRPLECPLERLAP